MTNYLSFPGLGIGEFAIRPVAFSLFGKNHFVLHYRYAFLMSANTSLATFWMISFCCLNS